MVRHNDLLDLQVTKPQRRVGSSHRLRTPGWCWRTCMGGSGGSLGQAGGALRKSLRAATRLTPGAGLYVKFSELSADAICDGPSAAGIMAWAVTPVRPSATPRPTTIRPTAPIRTKACPLRPGLPFPHGFMPTPSSFRFRLPTPSSKARGQARSFFLLFVRSGPVISGRSHIRVINRSRFSVSARFRLRPHKSIGSSAL